MSRPQDDDSIGLKKSTTVRTMMLATAVKVASPLAPDLAAAGLERLFRGIRRHPVPGREVAWLAGAREERVPVWLRDGERRLAVWSWGEGPAVLLAHGWEGRGSQLGAFVAPLVAAGFRAVAFDAPGHGRSPGALSSLPEMAAAVAQLGRWLGGVAGVVAHSAGSAATTLALAEDPFAVGRLVYVAPPANPGRFLHLIGRLLGLPPRLAERTQRRIEGRFDVRFDDIAPIALAPRMEAPLLAIHDRGDREVPFAEGEQVAARWPGARLRATDGLGHRRILRDAKVVREAVDFLAAGSARSADGAAGRGLVAA